MDNLDHADGRGAVDEVQEGNGVPEDNEVLADNVDRPCRVDDELHLGNCQGKERPVANYTAAESTPLVHAEQIGTCNVASKGRCGNKVHTVDSVKEPSYKE